MSSCALPAPCPWPARQPNDSNAGRLPCLRRRVARPSPHPPMTCWVQLGRNEQLHPVAARWASSSRFPGPPINTLASTLRGEHHPSHPSSQARRARAWGPSHRGWKWPRASGARVRSPARVLLRRRSLFSVGGQFACIRAARQAALRAEFLDLYDVARGSAYFRLALVTARCGR